MKKIILSESDLTRIIKKIINEQEIDYRSEKIKSMVNKYGIERALEMIAGGKDTIRNAYRDNPSEFLNQFNDLIPVEKGDKIFYLDKDRLALFYYYPDRKNGYVYINYDRIWAFFSNVIGLKHSEIENIIKKWLEETYNLKGLTPGGGFWEPIPTL